MIPARPSRQKPPHMVLDDLIASKQVHQYVSQYGLCLVTNLREFALVRSDRADKVAVVMHYSLATTDAEFWSASPAGLVHRHEQGIVDFLVNVFTWDAEITAHGIWLRHWPAMRVRRCDASSINPPSS